MILASAAANAAFFAAIEPLQNWIRSRSALARKLEQRTDPLAESLTSTDQSLLIGQVVLVGYGRVGKYIGNVLREKKSLLLLQRKIVKLSTC